MVEWLSRKILSAGVNMKKPIAAIIAVLAFLALSCLPSEAQSYYAAQGSCTVGGQTVSVAGLQSTNYVQASYPSCTVTVYLTGTTTPATIFSSNTGTSLSNPFTANSYGSWIFWVNTSGVGYDVVMSGGGMPFSVTWTDLIPGAGSGGSMVYPAAGVACSNGSGWCTSYGAANPFPINFIQGWPSSVSGYLFNNGTGTLSWGNPVGSGTVTTFTAANLSPLFSSSVANPSSTPALSFSLSNAPQNYVWAGPATGGAGAPSYRALIPADIPSLPYLSSGTTLAASLSAAAHKWLNSYNAGTGAFTQTQPATSDLSDWPSNASGALTNDGSGNYSWVPVGTGSNTIVSNLQTLTPWHVCATTTNCGGGATAGTVTKAMVSDTTHLSSTAAVIGLSGTSANLLSYYNTGAQNTATNWSMSGNFYFPSLTGIAALEYDMYQYPGDGYKLQMGAQCNYAAGYWDIWNQSGSWVHTSIVCNSTVWPAASSDALTSVWTTAPSAHTYQPVSLTINGTLYSLSAYGPYTATNVGFSANSGVDVQIDCNSSPGCNGTSTGLEWVDNLSITYGTSGGGGGGSGTVSSGSQYYIPMYTTSGTGTTVGPSQIYTDSTGTFPFFQGLSLQANVIPITSSTNLYSYRGAGTLANSVLRYSPDNVSQYLLYDSRQFGTMTSGDYCIYSASQIVCNTAPPTGVTQIVAGTNVTITPTGGTGAVTINSTSTASTAFSALTGSTNTSAAMLVGTGASLGTTGTGTISATSVTGETFPSSGIIVGTTDTQTLTNKTIDGVTPATMAFVDPTSSIQTQLNSKLATATAATTYVAQTTTVNGHALSSNVTVTASDVGLGSVTNNAQTQAAIVPNTTPSAGQDLVGNAGGTAYAPVTMSGDCTRASTGAITCTKTNGTAFAASATSTTAGTGLNGTAIPTSAPLLGTNSSAQPISVTTLPTSAEPAHTGDMTNSAGSLATSVVKVNGNTPGGVCTNQFARSISSSAVPTCASIAAADLTATVIPAVAVPTPGTSITLAAPSGFAICTGTCTVSLPVPAAGYQFCIMNDDNVSTAITLSALGSSARYENTARTSYGTAGTGTFTATAAAGNMVCIVGRDSTHYLTTNYIGTWTAN